MSPATQRISGLTKKVIKKQNQGKNKKKTKNNKKKQNKTKTAENAGFVLFCFFLFFLVFFDFSGGSSCRIVFLVIRFLIVFYYFFAKIHFLCSTRGHNPCQTTTTPSVWRCSFRGLRSRFEAWQLKHWTLFKGSHQVPHHNLLRPQLLLLCPLLLLLLTAQCLSVPETFCPCRPDCQRPASSHLSTGSGEPGPLDFVLGNNWKVRLLLPKSQSSPLICQPTTLWSCGATTYLAPRSCEVDETSRVSCVFSLLELDGDCPLSCGEKHGRHRGSSHSSFAFRFQRHCISALCAGRRGSRAVGPAHETGVLALRPRDGVGCRGSPCRTDSRASRSHWSINEG